MRADFSGILDPSLSVQAVLMIFHCPSIVAQQCIQKSLLLLNFLPARTKTESHDSGSMEDFGQCHKDKRRRTSSVVELDFQPADAAPVCRVTDSASPEGSRTADLRRQSPDSPQAEKASASPSKLLDSGASEQEDVSSPPSTPTRKPPFSRGRLRLLSFRSMEEPKSPPSIKEKYPILKHVLDFIKDQSLSHER